MFYSSLMTFLFFFCISIIAVEPSWTEQTVSRYVHNSEMQRRWAFTFMAPHLQRLQGTELMLDIGCGDGKITADISRFVPLGCVIGIDPSQAMIDWARKQYSPLEYSNVAFLQAEILDFNFPGIFDVVISNCALHLCFGLPKTFKKLASFLKPEGKLLIQFPAFANLAWKQARANVQIRPRWARYWRDVSSLIGMDEEMVLELLNMAELTPIRVEKIITIDPFVNREEFKEFLMATLAPVVPIEEAPLFYTELVDEYVRLRPEVLLPNGTIEACFHRIEIEAIR